MSMRRVRTYSAYILLLLFCCYYSGVSLFSHVHIINGATVIHSHLGGNSEHDHSESQHAVIELLSHFHSECAVDFNHAESPFFLLSELYIGYEAPTHLNEVHAVYKLRGPPQA